MQLRSILLLLCGLLLAVGTASADEILSVKAGYISLSPDGDFAVDGGGLAGTRINLKNDLNYDDSEDFIGEAALNLGPFRLSAGYLPIEFSGNGNLNRQIIFNGQTFNVNTNVSSDVKIDMYDFGLVWHIINIDDLPVRLQFGPELSVKYIDGEVSMRDSSGALNEKDSISAPVPTIGARARIGLADWLALVGRVGYLEYDGNTLLDADGQIEFSPLPLVGVYAGYRYIDMEVDESGVFIDATLDGPYGGVFVRF